MKLRRRYRLHALVATLLLVASLVACDSARHSDNLAEAARARVQVGMSAQEVENRLSDAWFHAKCYTSIHLFFFGSRDLDKTGVVVVRFEGYPDQQTVRFVGRIANYRLVAAYSCCLRNAGLEAIGCEE